LYWQVGGPGDNGVVARLSSDRGYEEMEKKFSAHGRRHSKNIGVDLEDCTNDGFVNFEALYQRITSGGVFLTKISESGRKDRRRGGPERG
jgi:hypothetical protein